MNTPRTALAVVAATAALGAAVVLPASAQESSPSLSPSPSGMVVDQPSYTTPTPSQASTASPEPSATATATVSPSPRPTMTPHVDRACPSIRVEAPAGPVEVNAPFTITATEANNQRVRFSLTRLAPAPVAEVRSTPDTTTTTWTLRLPETHRLRVDASLVDSGCIGGGTGPVDLLIPVRAQLTIAAQRTAPRVYVFTGRVLPGRGQAVSLYRTGSDGTAAIPGSSGVLTARTTVRPDGTYRIERHFTGSGRFGFYTAVGTSGTNTAGASPLRPTVIH